MNKPNGTGSSIEDLEAIAASVARHAHSQEFEAFVLRNGHPMVRVFYHDKDDSFCGRTSEHKEARGLFSKQITEVFWVVFIFEIPGDRAEEEGADRVLCLYRVLPSDEGLWRIRKKSCSAAYEIFPDIDHDGKDFVAWKLPGDRYDITITPTQKFREESTPEDYSCGSPLQMSLSSNFFDESLHDQLQEK